MKSPVIFNKFPRKLYKNTLLAVVLGFMGLVYYFFLFWSIVPLFQASNSGLDYRFWELDKLEDNKYRQGVLYLLLVHGNVFLMIFSLIRVSLADPGSLCGEFKEVFSFVPAKNLGEYGERREFIAKYLNENKTSSNANIHYVNMRRNINDRRRNIILRSSSVVKRKESLSIVLEETPSNEFAIDEEILNHSKAMGTKETLNTNFNLQSTQDIQLNLNHNTNQNYFQKMTLNQLKTNSHNNSLLNNRKHLRACRFCLVFKPSRTHHCRSCNKCIRISDHHCYFLNNCIGNDNYKYFILFLFYSLTLLIILIFSMFSGLNFIYLEYGMDSLEFFFFSIVIVICIIIGVFLGYLFSLHIWLITKGMTTIEYLEKYKSLRNKKKSSNLEKLQNFGEKSSKTEILNNFKKIFGKNLLLAFLPFKSNSKYDGY